MAGRRGTFWQPEEIEIMLDLILQSRDVRLLMKSTHLPTKAAYGWLAHKMASRGYARSSKQICSKFKIIKSRFLASLELWQGIPSESGQTPYHSKMMEIWEAAGKPHWEDRHHSSIKRLRMRGQQSGSAGVGSSEQPTQEDTEADKQPEEQEPSDAIGKMEVKVVSLATPSTGSPAEMTDDRLATVLKEQGEIRQALELLAALVEARGKQTAAALVAQNRRIRDLEQRQDWLELRFIRVIARLEERLKMVEAFFPQLTGEGSSSTRG